VNRFSGGSEGYAMKVLHNIAIGVIAIAGSSGVGVPIAFADQAEVGDYVRMLGGDRVGRSGETELDNLSDQSALNFRTFSLHRVTQPFRIARAAAVINSPLRLPISILSFAPAVSITISTA